MSYTRAVLYTVKSSLGMHGLSFCAHFIILIQRCSSELQYVLEQLGNIEKYFYCRGPQPGFKKADSNMQVASTVLGH